MTHARTRALMGATIAASFAAALTLTGGALASPARESASTPVPIPTPDGQISS